jgi:hypothetical protein
MSVGSAEQFVASEDARGGAKQHSQDNCHEHPRGSKAIVHAAPRDEGSAAYTM